MTRKKLDSKIELEIITNVDRFKEIFETGIMYSPTEKLHYSAFLEIIVLLNDLLQKANQLKIGVNFEDDVINMDDPFYYHSRKKLVINNITDTIRFFRNAMCHIDSKNRYIDPQINFSFNRVGPRTKFKLTKEITLENPYPDEDAYYYGPQRIFIKRHIEKAFTEVVENFKNNFDIPFI